MRDFSLIALSMAPADPSIAIAASRADGLGVVDLSYVRDGRVAADTVARLAKHSRTKCGIKVDGAAEAFVAEITADLPAEIGTVILVPGSPESLHRQVKSLRSRQLKVVLEATSLQEALLGERLGVDGLIAKGNEAGGRVAEETTFVLLQRLLARTALPVWAHGGIGLHTAAACYAAGAAGVVLDAQLAMTRECRLPDAVRAVIERMDGSETACVAGEAGELFRLYANPRSPAVKGLLDACPAHHRSAQVGGWREEVARRLAWDRGDGVWPLGQDAGFARALARRFHTVGGVLEGVREAVQEHLRLAAACKPLDEGAPLARSHRTRYPIVQGPMTRVSDQPAFAARVAEAGALPFLALALMRAADVGPLLEATRRAVGDRPWGVGILGFVPVELRQEQLDVIRSHHPSFVIIAGGRPDQALSLEEVGIPTYLHVPSPGLLELFLNSGARRFVFEGRECGGHAGPRSSFVLWESMIDTLLGSLPPAELADCHVLFAGGIHDARSAAMVAVAAAPLAAAGARTGVLLGTAYLFTEEAVETGAIVRGFQHEAIHCNRTVLLETGPGHETRCAETRYAEVFEEERRRLLAEQASADELRASLEALNLGRLRIAAKGLGRHPSHPRDASATKLVAVGEDDQRAQGMYMMGQVAALRAAVVRIADLHHNVATGSSELLAEAARRAPARRPDRERPCDIAVIGMACLLPQAPDLETYWRNILAKVDAITEVPEDRWDWHRYFDPDPKAPDKVYSRWGGFLDEVAFDPMRYGIPPSSVPFIEPLQLLTLDVVREALLDAGYLDRPFPRKRTAVILGVGGGVADLGQQYALRAGLPMIFDQVPPAVLGRLPEWTEDSFPGILLNVAAGRVANRFDLGGVNYTVDAACASSLAAVHLATRELEMGTSDMVVVGGADTVQNPFGYLAFSKTQALSRQGRCRTFDEGADGIAISEGIGILVLKRLRDAERDGDRIYAVIKGVAGSSDGRDKQLTAPRPEGQVLALERAYAQAGINPATVTLVEAHGTGTVAGDGAEVETLRRVFNAAGAPRRGCAIGSVKSMIGHTKCTAGVAGLIKVAKALHHKVLPPTINVERPNPKAHFAESPFYVNTETRPWLGNADGSPRRAGVSAFGFGGTNFHGVLEEYTGGFLDAEAPSGCATWPNELFLFAATDSDQLRAVIDSVERAIGRGANPAMADLAYTLWRQSKGLAGRCLAVVAGSLDDLQAKLRSAVAALGAQPNEINDPRGVYFAPEAPAGGIAFLFPGQGSQHVGMLNELAVHFQEVRTTFEKADHVLSSHIPERLTSYVFPPPPFGSAEREAAEEALTRTEIAQPALGAASMALVRLLDACGVKPAVVAGHSYGEYVALCTAEVFSEEVLYELSEVRGQCIRDAANGDMGTMAAIFGESHAIAEVLRACEGVWAANFNAPGQVVISGSREAIHRATDLCASRGIRARSLAVGCAFHSPLVAPARDRLVRVLKGIHLHTPTLPVFSNTTAAPYPEDPGAVADVLADHLVNPVRFADEVRALYEAGARIFVEVGPRAVLTGLTKEILEGRPHLSVALDADGRSGLHQLQLALAQLAAYGVPVELDRLFAGRPVEQLDLRDLESYGRSAILPPTTWLVSGGRARPAGESRQGDRSSSVGKSPGPGDGAALGRGRTDAAPALQATGATSGAAPPESVADAITPMPVPASNGADAGVNEVMVRFQRLMRQFLETQQQVMSTYLTGAPAHSTAPSETPLPQTVPFPPQHASPPAPRVQLQEPRVQPQEAVAPPPTAIDSSGLVEMLLTTVSERTGYPTEMLDLDLDIEADLGITSIKRIEILGSVEQALPAPAGDRIQQVMETLTKVKTLRGLADAIAGAVGPQGQEGPPSSGSLQSVADNRTGGGGPNGAVTRRATEPGTQAMASGSVRGALPRFVVELVAAGAPDDSFTPPLEGVFLLTDDGGGIATRLADAIRERGCRAVLVRPGRSAGRPEGNLFVADLTDAGSVKDVVSAVRERWGPVIGLIHLLPLAAGLGTGKADVGRGVDEWRSRVDLEVKGLFHLVKAAAPDLTRAADAGGAWVLGATALRGSASGQGQFFPGHGGAAGLIKTLAQEWPRVRCKVVYLEPTAAPPDAATQLLAEVTTLPDATEVGYRGGRRLFLKPAPAPLAETPGPIGINEDSVILVTGGARGITAEAAKVLAKHYRPVLVIVGRSPLPAPEEPPETARLSTPQELKATLLARLRCGQRGVGLSAVEAAYSRLMGDREIRRNLDAIRRAGAQVHYRQVDTRDATAFAALIDDLYAAHGRIDGVIHGAGVIEDKLVEDKNPSSFDRVFDTKVTSALVLSTSLRPESVQFLVFFSSVAACFGNRGQCDYAAANEVLNALAAELDWRWPGRVVAINWGPWNKTGMAEPEVLAHLIEEGLQPIDPELGAHAFHEELRRGQKGEAEVILGAGPWAAPACSPDGSRLAQADAVIGVSGAGRTR